MLQLVTDYLKIGLGFERLLFLLLVDILVLHIVSCLWLICASMYAKEYDVVTGQLADENTLPSNVQLTY